MTASMALCAALWSVTSKGNISAFNPRPRKILTTASRVEASAVKQNRCARFREALSHGEAKAARCAGNNRNTTFK
jgi:hypothetical protein